mgnify:CR=1 FL=1
MALTVLAGKHPDQQGKCKLSRCFDPGRLAFCRDLSNALLRHPKAREHPELVALGFWLRDSHLRQLQQKSGTDSPGLVRRPLGLVLHFAPANVDTLFVYSWVCSLLMGNSNVVRLSSQASVVTGLLLDVLNELFSRPEHTGLAEQNSFVNFPHDDPAASSLSLQAHARVIWGGDDAVQAIRRLPCGPRCRDIPFTDRYSAAVINGDGLDSSNLQSLAERLWRDVHTYSQMACSSPRILFWLGSTLHREALWSAVGDLAGGEAWEMARLNEHLVVSQWLEAAGASEAPAQLGQFSVLPLSGFFPEALKNHPGQGLCYLCEIDELTDVTILDDRCQTLGYWGVEREQLLNVLETAPIRGLERIVPIGSALEFSPWWDGMDLFAHLSCFTVVQ